MIQLKILLYKYESYKQCISAFSTIPDAKEDVKKSYKDIEEKIKKNKMFKCLDGKDELLKQWRPSWNCIAKRTILSEWNSKNMYNIISQYSHNSYVRLVSACRDAQNVEECDRDAIFMQLFEFTAIFINDYIKLLEIDYNKILEEDEIALLQEFLCFAEKNPSDVQ